MNLSVSLERRDAAVVARVNGEIDLSNAAELERELLNALADGDVLVIDLLEIDYLDSSALATMHRVFLVARERGGEMWVVTGDRGMAKRLFAITGLDQVLHTTDSVEAALETIERSPE